MRNNDKETPPTSDMDATTPPQETPPSSQTSSPTNDGHEPPLPSSQGKKRGPNPGKYQNGKVCFSSWFPTEFMVKLRRFASNLGSDPATVIRRELAPICMNTRLSQEDLAEIELSNKSKNKSEQE